MVFSDSHTRVPGGYVSGDGASRQADLKCFQRDIILQRPGPCGPDAESECGKGKRGLDFRLLSPPPNPGRFL